MRIPKENRKLTEKDIKHFPHEKKEIDYGPDPKKLKKTKILDFGNGLQYIPESNRAIIDGVTYTGGAGQIKTRLENGSGN